MSQFYGTLKGNRGEATRCGTANSGIVTEAASWNGCVRTSIFLDSKGVERFYVHMVPWHGVGETLLIAEGIVGDAQSVVHGMLPPASD